MNKKIKANPTWKPRQETSGATWPQCQRGPEFSEGVNSPRRQRERLRSFRRVLKKAKLEENPCKQLISFSFHLSIRYLLFLPFVLRGKCRLFITVIIYFFSSLSLVFLLSIDEGTVNSVRFIRAVLLGLLKCE